MFCFGTEDPKWCWIIELNISPVPLYVTRSSVKIIKVWCSIPYHSMQQLCNADSCLSGLRKEFHFTWNYFEIVLLHLIVLPEKTSPVAKWGLAVTYTCNKNLHYRLIIFLMHEARVFKNSVDIIFFQWCGTVSLFPSHSKMDGKEQCLSVPENKRN